MSLEPLPNRFPDPVTVHKCSHYVATEVSSDRPTIASASGALSPWYFISVIICPWRLHGDPAVKIEEEGRVDGNGSACKKSCFVLHPGVQHLHLRAKDTGIKRETEIDRGPRKKRTFFGVLSAPV